MEQSLVRGEVLAEILQAQINMLGRRTQFGIGFLFFVTACVAGYLAAYRFGIDEIRAARSKAISARTYDVSDLVTPAAGATIVEKDLANLRQLIEATVDGDWDRRDFSVDPFASTRSFVITQTGESHAKIQELLEGVRAMKRTQR